jgi:hypothetical protein
MTTLTMRQKLITYLAYAIEFEQKAITLTSSGPRKATPENAIKTLQDGKDIN